MHIYYQEICKITQKFQVTFHRILIKHVMPIDFNVKFKVQLNGQ